MSTVPKSIQDLKKMKIQDALQLLEEAAKDSSGDIRSLISDRYKDAESAIEKLFGAKPSELFEQAKDQVKDVSDRVKKGAQDSVRVLDDSAHENPWAYVGGGVVLGGIVGFLLGRK